LGSFYSLVPRPPRRDLARHLKYGKTALCFRGKLVSDYPEDQERRFIIEFFLSDETVRVFEQSMRNSGFVGGKFLERRRFKNAQTGEWFKSKEFIVGSKITINRYTFELLEADVATTNLLQGGEEFTRASVEEILSGLSDSLWNKSFRKTKTFRDIDKDGGQTIDINEFSNVCASLGWKMDEQKKRKVFEKFDVDGSGEIGLDEFFKALEKFKFDHTANGSSKCRGGSSKVKGQNKLGILTE